WMNEDDEIAVSPHAFARVSDDPFGGGSHVPSLLTHDVHGEVISSFSGSVAAYIPALIYGPLKGSRSVLRRSRGRCPLRAHHAGEETARRRDCAETEPSGILLCHATRCLIQRSAMVFRITGVV